VAVERRSLALISKAAAAQWPSVWNTTAYLSLVCGDDIQFWIM